MNADLNVLTGNIIGAAIEVHRRLGPGLLERVYEEALCHELTLRRVPFQRQQWVPVVYKGVTLDADLRFDLLVAGQILVELKAKEALAPTDKPQLLTYLRLLNLRLGLLINFHTPYLRDGIHRVINGLKEPSASHDPPSF